MTMGAEIPHRAGRETRPLQARNDRVQGALPPSDEGGGFAAGEDGGREKQILRCFAPQNDGGENKWAKGQRAGERVGKMTRAAREKLGFFVANAEKTKKGEKALVFGCFLQNAAYNFLCVSERTQERG